MAPAGTELIVGAVGDPAFGPLVACGAGGVAVELLGDVQVRLAPRRGSSGASSPTSTWPGAAAAGQELTAGEIAATEPVTASPFDSLADVARVMGDHDVAHLVVVDGKDAEPMGVISTRALASD